MAVNPEKFATIQRWINPAILRTHQVQYRDNLTASSMIGQVLFFDMDGRAAQADGGSCYVGVYDRDGGLLKALFRFDLIVSITPWECED